MLERLPDAPHEPDSVADARLVGFDAFLADRRIYGWIRLSEDRLTDLLNEHDELRLVNVQLERLSDGRLEWHEHLVLARDDLLAVRASGPRGDAARRHRTQRHPVAVQSGPFLIGGYLHACPGVHALDEIAQRPPITPLSVAWLEYWRDGRRRAQWGGTILFNRMLTDAVEVVADEDLEVGVLTWPLSRRGR